MTMGHEKVLIQCPACRTVYTVPARLLGKRFKCKRCGIAFETASTEPPQQRPSAPPRCTPVEPQAGHPQEVNVRHAAPTAVHEPALVAAPATATRPFPWRAVVLAVAALVLAAVLFCGNFHIITGRGVGLRVVARDSFGFMETFIDADAITGMPWIAAKSRFPIGCRILQREGIIESDEAFRRRIEVETKEKIDKAMEDARRDTERLLRDLQR